MVQQSQHAGETMVVAAIPRDATGQAMNGLIDMHHKPLLPVQYQHPSWAITHSAEQDSSSSQFWGMINATHLARTDASFVVRRSVIPTIAPHPEHLTKISWSGMAEKHLPSLYQSTPL